MIAYFEHLWLYLVLLVGIIAVPGMDMMFVLANALSGGRRAGLAATLGIMLGGVAHTVIGFAAVALLSSLIPRLFPFMLIAGSLYMIWIGFTLARSRIEINHVDRVSRNSFRQIAAQGFVTCLVNPKAWMFVMSVVPQFLKPAFGPLLPQAAVMGLMTITVQAAVYGAIALAALKARDALVSNDGATIWIGRGAGVLLVFVAAFTLIQAVGYLAWPGN